MGSFNMAMLALDMSATDYTKVAGLFIVEICLTNGVGSILLRYTDFFKLAH
jgi:hypothetical protein